MGSLSWHLAWRYLRRHPERRTLAFTTVVSVAGVGLGVAALLVVMGVLGGLERFIADSVVTVDAPLVVVPSAGDSVPADSALVAAIEDIPGVVSTSPYIEGEAVARLPSRGVDSGCRVRGVDPGKELTGSGLPMTVSYGSLALHAEDGFPCTVMGLYLAEEFAHPLGDTIVFFPPRSFFTSRGFSVGRCILSGAVETGLPVNDRAIAYVPLEVASGMFLPDGGYSGISIRLEEGADLDRAAAAVAGVLPPGVEVQTWRQRNPSLTASMKLEKTGSFAAILLVILVATFNIVGTIARTVIERRRDISILKAMGGNRALVLRVFLWEGVLVGLSGVLLGLALGLCACWIIGGTGLITLPDVYSFHENIPVMLSVRDTLTVCISALLLSILSGAFPALKAASLDLVRGLRG